MKSLPPIHSINGGCNDSNRYASCTYSNGWWLSLFKFPQYSVPKLSMLILKVLKVEMQLRDGSQLSVASTIASKDPYKEFILILLRPTFWNRCWCFATTLSWAEECHITSVLVIAMVLQVALFIYTPKTVAVPKAEVIYHRRTFLVVKDTNE